jgi:predicted Fe-S protein YdhL (DUF1289 family)
MVATVSIADRARQARAVGENVPSPCISVCKMDAQRVYCQGCLRTIDEIRAWSTMSDTDKRTVWSRIEQRATAQGD